MWPWTKRPPREGFPQRFKKQRIGVPEARAVVDRPAEEIAAYFRSNPDVAKSLLAESYDKRYSPSTYITERDKGFEVGWYSRQLEEEHAQHFSSLADAATDYLLLSLGKGRWKVRKQ